MKFQIVLYKQTRKCLWIFLLLLSLISYLPLNAQNLKSTGITIQVKNEHPKSVFDKITLVTNYKFFYDESIFDESARVTVNQKNVTLNTVLNDITKQTNVEFKIDQNIITVIKGNPLNTKKEIAKPSITITGTVKDEKGESLPGVNVIIKGSNQGTITDIDGNYSLSVQDTDAVITYSYLGYAAVEKEVGSQRNINIVLSDSTTKLGEVVVIGYGTAKQKDVTGAIKHVQLENSPLQDLPNANPLLALSGTVGGININPQSLAGQDPIAAMSIRGENSIDKSSSGLNRPLLVIDGLIFNGSINEINTQDVASIDILKDASSAAIYGARSANGVIIITTKKGKTEKPTISLSSSYAIQSWSRKPEMQDDMEVFLKNRWNYRVDRGDFDPTTTFDPSLILNTTELSAYEKGIYTNWLDEITQFAPVQSYNLNISGSSKKVNYYLSAGLYDQKGVILNDHYKKVTFMGKIESSVNDYIKVGGRINYYTADNSGLRPKMQEATWMTPLSFTTNQTEGYEDWLVSHPGGSSTSPIIGSTVRPGPAYATNELKDNSINGAGWVTVNVPWIEGLKYEFTANGTYASGVDNLMFDPRFWVDTRVPAQMDNYNSLYLSRVNGYAQSSWEKTWLINSILSYTNKFDVHSIDAMVGYTRDASTAEILKATGSGFDMPVSSLLWEGLHLAKSQTINKNKVASQNVGYLARLNYNLAEKYFITGNFRRDGFSGFAPGKKFGNFAGISAGWTVSKENFMKDIKWLEYLKLRLSYGETGNQGISPYETLAKVATSYNVYGESSYLDLYPTSLSNKDLTWSVSAIQNLGIDFSLLASRISGTIDIYHSKTKNQLLTRSVPILTGYSSVLTNVGQVDNKGLEITLNTTPVQGDGNRHLTWESSIVFDLNQNKLVELYGTFDSEGNPVNDIGSAPGGNAYLIGKSIHSIWDLKMLGIVQEDDVDYIEKYGAKPGDVKFLDKNEDGKINSQDRFYQGDRDPLFTANFNNTISYKNFSLYFSFKWMAGNDEHFLGRNPYGVMVSTSVNGNAQLKDVHPWTTDSPNNEYPRVGWVNSNSYQFWRNRDFIKLKDVSLSYNIPKTLLNKIGVEALRLSVSGNNLFTLTDWNGLDPEDGGIIAAQPGSNYNWSFPVLRTISFSGFLSF